MAVEHAEIGDDYGDGERDDENATEGAERPDDEARPGLGDHVAITWTDQSRTNQHLYLSSLPTVVMVTSAHHRPSGMDLKSLLGLGAILSA